jgi:hypothetical protein
MVGPAAPLVVSLYAATLYEQKNFSKENPLDKTIIEV